MIGIGVLIAETSEDGGDSFVAVDGDLLRFVVTDLDMDLMWIVHRMEQLMVLEVCPLDANRNDLVTYISSTSGIFWETFPRFFENWSSKWYETLLLQSIGT